MNDDPRSAHSWDPATMPSSVSVQMRRYLMRHAFGMCSRVGGSWSMRWCMLCGMVMVLLGASMGLVWVVWATGT